MPQEVLHLKNINPYSKTAAMDKKDEEYERKAKIRETHGEALIEKATEIAVKTEVNGSYYETTWKKGEVLLDEIDRAGYMLVKKT